MVTNYNEKKLFMKRLIFTKLIILLTFSSHFVFAQSGNLIPNASFERYRVLPNDVAQGSKCISSWKIPNMMGSGEYYHSNCDTKKAGTEKNHFGSQTPHTGNAYMGLCVAKKFREYLQIELSHSLIKGKQYRIAIFISCADKIGLSTINEFNVLFSQNPFVIPTNEDLLEPPKVKFIGEFKNKKEWVELSTVFTADGTEQFMTFGSFSYIEDGVRHGKIDGFAKYAHYYVDDVSVTLINDEISLTQESKIEEVSLADTLMDYNLGEVYVFDNLLFESGKSILLPNDYPELENLIQFLEKKGEYNLLITGHTDNVGNLDRNKKLSYDRANALKSYLIEKGINKDAIIIDGKGDTVPLSSNDTEEGRKKNRRVEISIIK
ncbi:MAG: OOP family OmpA-OmpF porin [Crocinitomix sp.]|jgi:OOP family OmpA-OmpF porin